MNIYGQARSHSISTDAPRVHGFDKDQSAVCMQAGHAFWKTRKKRMEGKGACKGRGIPPSVAMLHPRSIYGLSGGSKMRNTPSPHLPSSR
jgi:hypothetical protein